MKKKILVMILLTPLVFLFGRHNVFADSLGFTKGEVLELGSLSEGVTYEHFLGVSSTDYGTVGNQQVSIVKAQADSAFQIAVWTRLSGNIVVGSNLIELARDYELNHPGYEVLAGINGDYFNPSNDVPINAIVQNGDTVKYTNFYLERYFSVGFTNDERLFVTNKTNTIESKFVLSIYADDGVRIVKEVALQGLNQIPGDGATALYYKSLNTVDLSGSYGFAADIQIDTQFDSLLIKGTMTEETTSVSTDTKTVTIVTKDAALLPYLESGAKIRVQKFIAGVYDGIDDIIGVGSRPLESGLIKAFADINDQNVDFASARSPRTSFGFSESGDFILATFDGRQGGIDGVNLREMAFAMQAFGAVDAFNLDGGGSTQLVIKEGDDFKMLNTPCENPYRKVSNAIFIVRPAVMVTGVVTNETPSSFDFHFTVGLSVGSIISQRVYLNDVLQEVSGTTLILTNLSEAEIYYISVEIDYQINGIDYTSTFLTKRVNLGDFVEPEEPHLKLPPDGFAITITKDDGIAGFRLFITFDDPDKTFVKMYLLYDEERLICSKAVGGYTVDVPYAEEGKNYVFKLEYFYQIDTIVPVSQITAASYNFHFQTPLPIDEDPENPDDPSDLEPQGLPFFWYVIFGVSALISGVTLFLLLKRK